MRAVNLLTPELRSAQKGSSAAPRPSAMETSGGIGAFAVIGALALVVVAVAGYVLAGNTVKDREATLAAVSTKNDETVKKAADLKPYADFQDLASNRANTVQALAGSRFDWEQALRDLSRALPSNVYVSSLTGSVGTGVAGASGIRSAIPSPAIELAGCTRSQPAVAALMSRLRNIQGVTRVSLSKSDKADDTGSAAGAIVGPCGNGSPPSFDVVIFFEKSTVGADLSAVTGDAGTSTTPAAAAAPTAGTGSTAKSAASGKTDDSAVAKSPSADPTTPPTATPGATP